jgi:ribose-phosphate pyrophosphokinase
LTGLYLLVDYFKKKQFESDLVVVAADIGISKRARDVAVRLNAPLAIMEKHRSGNDDRSQILMVIGDVAGKVALVVDDEISTAGTLINNVNTLIERGAKEVYFCATHPIFSGPAIERIAASRVKEVVVTDSLPVTNGKKLDKVTVLPLAPLLGEAIHRIHTGQSVGEMFNGTK